MRKKVVIGVAAALAGVLLLGIAGRNRHRDDPPGLRSGVTDDPAVAAVLARSCQDCHSDGTRRPWYGYVPPASWLLDHDISGARSHMDFSRWGTYSLDDKQQILTEIGAVVRNHQMPPGRYLFMHPDARLSDSQASLLYTWAKRERRKVRAQAKAAQQ